MKNHLLTRFLTALGLIMLGPALVVQAQETTGSSYWSRENEPVIYGASEITIPQGTVFNLEDTRFRVFAKDFEDGDLTQQLSVTGAVNTDAAGSYMLNYAVTDSDGNSTSLKVPVTVVNQTDEIIVKRIMYTTPSVWNMDLAGFNRNNYGDSQHLGIYLPAGSSAQVRILEGTKKLNINLYGNDRMKESSVSVANDGEWKTVSNVVGGESYDCVPLVNTPVMDRGTAVNETFTIEVKYSDEVNELIYYHQGDDEKEFRQEWNQRQDSFGIFENDVITVIIPYADLDKTTNYHKYGFSTLDEFGQYWQKAVARMDELVGLEMNPKDPVNQNVPTRFVVKANDNGWGAAYYSSSHVGINNASISAFFEVNWGGLHEFAHGYQGSLGRGVMDLGEVSNNILGYYIQQDKDIYIYPGNWLGEFEKKEEQFNAKRLETGVWADNYVDVRLYVICNLLDYFEGGTTYAKMFKWYRAQLNEGKAMTNTDAYAESLADIYGVNVIPYLEAWGLEVGEDTRNKVREMDLPAINILKDMVDEESLAVLMEAHGITEKYEIVDQSILEEIKAAVTINITIDTFEAIAGQRLYVMDGDRLVKEIIVDSDKVSFELPVGTYTLKMPVSASHSSNSEFIVVKEGSNEVNITYTSFNEHVYEKAMTLKVRGVYNTYGYVINFDEDYTAATVTLNGANIGRNTPYVKIFNANNELLQEELVTQSGSAFYFDYNKGSYEVNLEPGYIIEVHHPDYNRVQMFSKMTGEVVSEYSPSQATTRYIVTQGGIRLEKMSDEEAEETAYRTLKTELIKIIENYMAKASEEELADVYSNRAEKDEVLIAYANLRPQDGEPYAEFIKKVRGEAVEEEKVTEETEPAEPEETVEAAETEEVLAYQEQEVLFTPVNSPAGTEEVPAESTAEEISEISMEAAVEEISAEAMTEEAFSETAVKEWNTEAPAQETEVAGRTPDTAPYVSGPGNARIALGYDVSTFLYEAVSAYDFEDGSIEVNETTTRIVTDLDVNKAGTYEVTYYVKDSQGNEGSYVLTIVVCE